MKKISLKKLRTNFIRLIIDIALQFTFSFIILSLTGILVPFTFHRQFAAMLAEAIAFTLLGSYSLLLRLFWHQDTSIQAELNNAREKLVKGFTFKNIVKSFFNRVIIGMTVGVISYIGTNIALICMFILFPKQFAKDIEELNEIHDQYDISDANIVIHAPVIEEVFWRSLLLNMAKVTLHTLFYLYTAATEYYAHAMEHSNGVTATVEQERTDIVVEEVPAPEKETDDVNTLNKYIDRTSSIASAMSFAKAHFPVQWPHTFGLGVACGELANEYGDCVAPIVAHMTHNALARFRVR